MADHADLDLGGARWRAAAAAAGEGTHGGPAIQEPRRRGPRQLRAITRPRATYRMAFHPTLWPTLFTIPTMIALLGLGTWQLERLQWKEALIADRTARTSARPTERPPPGQLSSLGDLDFGHATVAGQFLHDREMYVAARTMEGSVGFQIVTPLQMADGHVVLVNRGWVPANRKDPAKRAEGQVAGTVTVDGAIRVPRPRTWLQRQLVPDNDPVKNFWFWNDLAAMGAYA